MNSGVGKNKNSKTEKTEKQRKAKAQRDFDTRESDIAATQAAEAAIDNMEDVEADVNSDAENDAEPQVKETKPFADKTSQKKEPSLFVTDTEDDDPELVVLGGAPVQSPKANKEDETSEGTIKYLGKTMEILRNKRTGHYSAKVGGDSSELSLSAQRKSLWNTVRPRAIAAVVIAPDGSVDDLVPHWEEKETKSGRFTIVEKFNAHFCQIKTKYDYKDGGGNAGSSWESRSSLKSKWGSAKVTLQTDITYGDRVLLAAGTKMAKVSRDILLAYIQSHPVSSSKGRVGQSSDPRRSPSYQPRTPTPAPGQGFFGQPSDRENSPSYQSRSPPVPDETLNVPSNEQRRNPPRAKRQASVTSVKDEDDENDA